MDRIVVLDGFTTTPLKPGEKPAAGSEEVTWSPLAGLGELVVYDRTPAERAAERIGGASIALTNKTPLTAQTFAACPALRYVGVLATGVNVVDLDAARTSGVTVTNVPGYSTASVAQHTIALLLELVSRVADHDAAVHSGRWIESDDFCFTTAPLTELAGRTLGVVGMGTIGQAVARIGAAMGMTIVAHSRTQHDLSLPVRWLGVDELFAESDVITLHCPLTEQTRGLVNAGRLAKMRRGALLINTSRGPLIDEAALAKALHHGTVAGAGLDVLSTEPPSEDNPLLIAPNCIITPHVAWATVASRHRLLATAAANLRAFLGGRPVNLVS